MSSTVKGLNKITTSTGVVFDLSGKQIDGNTVADLTDLASTANGAGASRIGIEDSGAIFTATNLEAALAEVKAQSDQHGLGLGSFWAEADLSTDHGGNITLSGEQTIDGVLSSTSRVLVSTQTDASENGLYTSAAGAWSRVADADASAEFTSNKTVSISSGDDCAGCTFAYTGSDNPTVDTDDLDFVKKSSSPLIDGTVTNVKLGADAVTGTKLADDAVNSEHVASGAIDLDHMSVNSIDSDQYVDGSIDLIHMSANSVDSDQYVDGSVDLIHLSADAVDGTKIADDAVDSEHLAAGGIDLEHMSANSIDSDQYVDGSIDLAHMSANSIDSDQYVDGSIDLAHMSVNSVDSDQYVDGSIDLVHMSANSVDSDQYVDASIDAAHLADGAELNKFYVTQIDHDSGVTNVLISNAPSGSHILEVIVKVTTAFDGTTPVLSLGVGGSVTAIATTTEVDLTTTSENPQVVFSWYTMLSTTDVIGTLTVSGASTGSCLVAVRRVI